MVALMSGCPRSRQVRADYKVVAKALTRKGNALAKLQRYEDAVAAYQKALTEHRFGFLPCMVHLAASRDSHGGHGASGPRAVCGRCMPRDTMHAASVELGKPAICSWLPAWHPAGLRARGCVCLGAAHFAATQGNASPPLHARAGAQTR